MPELATTTTDQTSLFQVGYALPTRKTEAFMVEKFITYAKKQGIHFIPINLSKSLTEQGPFDCIIHKLYSDQWNLDLEHFSINNPNATIIDRPTAIHRLHNRISMLEPISQLNIPKLNTPTQILIQDSKSLTSIIQNKNDNNLITFPVIAKPLLADGAKDAHNMSLVINHEGLTKLNPPIVLQCFVNHGGVVFKVYVAGEYVKCVKRSSLPDISNELEYSGGVMSFSQISSSVIAGDDAWGGNSNGNSSGEKAKMPVMEFVVEVANGLREALGLHLFNFDIIKDDKSDGYLVVDINYFPGYEKLPDYESVMVDFFLSVKRSQEENNKKIINVDDEKTQV